MTQHFKLNDDIIVREADKKLLSLTSGNVIELNETGFFVLMTFKESHSIKDIEKIVANNWAIETNDEKEELSDWLDSFIKSAIEEKILVEV